MEFCKRLCDNDNDCQAFEYDFNNQGKNSNCRTFSFSGYTGNGNEQAMCFLKNDEKVEVVTIDAFDAVFNALSPEEQAAYYEALSQDEKDEFNAKLAAAAEAEAENNTGNEEDAAENEEEQEISVTLVSSQTYCVDNFQISSESDSVNECAQKSVIEKRCFGGSDFFFYREADKMCSCCTGPDPLQNIGTPFYNDVHLYKRNTGVSPCKESKCQSCGEDGRTCDECLPEFELIMGACFKFD